MTETSTTPPSLTRNRPRRAGRPLRPLRAGDRHRVDRADEVHRVRGTRHRAARLQQPVDELDVGIFSVTTFSALLGVLEVAAAVLLAVKPWAPRLSAIGSIIAIGLFVATLSFLFTTPGVFEASQGGFPMLSSSGKFLIKDVALLGMSVWSLADALRAVKAAG